MKKKLNINTILILSVLVIGLAVFAWQRLTSEKGNIAVVDFNNSDVYYEISLDVDGSYTFSEGAFPVFLEVKDKKIAFLESRCPDHLCEDFGYIGNVDSYAVCMPAGVAVIIR